MVWTDAFRQDRGVLGGEALAQLLLGGVDAIEFDAHARPQPLLPWVYKLWDAGVRVPLVGGSGKDSNRVPVGAMRTVVLAKNVAITCLPLGAAQPARPCPRCSIRSRTQPPVKRNSAMSR